jgi:hypothetical protein
MSPHKKDSNDKQQQNIAQVKKEKGLVFITFF